MILHDYNPCLDCVDRTVVCHSDCERYARYRGKINAIHTAIQQDKARTAEYADYIRERNARA